MTDTLSHQPALPDLELPDYHGTKPAGMRTSLNGAGQRITRPHSIGDRVVLVVEAKVKSAGHDATDDGILYVEKLKVADAFELQGDRGARLLSTVRSLYRTAADAVDGVAGLADGDTDFGEAGWTDSAGVVLTPAELAELRGDPVRAVLSPDLTPAVIVFDDGSRLLWPDEFKPDTPRPAVGPYDMPGYDGAAVSRVVHFETGEDLEPPAATGEHSTPDDDALAEPVGVGDADGLSGDLGEGELDTWEAPDPATVKRLADAEPGPADFAVVDVGIKAFGENLAAITDPAHARRLLLAERRGRGRDARPRKAAVAMLEALVARLEA